MYTTLITAEELQALQRAGEPLMVFDCSFDLANPEAGAAQYRQAHVPGSVYAHLDRDLSAAHGHPGPHGTLVAHDAGEPASGGRHPLPSREAFATWLSGVGFANRMQAVVLDRNGNTFSGRLWWMLKWMGHEAVAVLDGGLAAWQAAGGPLTDREEPAHFQSNFVTGTPLVRLRTTPEVAAALDQPQQQTLIDARAPARYRGEVEPLDPIAGHIPGALNRPFGDNFAPDGRFKPADQLRAEFESLLAGRDAASVVHQCGSGVSALPNFIAMRIAGFAPGALYAGSWSEWSNTPGLPTRQGAQP